MIICLTLFTKNLYFMNSLYRFTINQNKMKTRVKKHTLQFCFIILIFNYIFCAADLHQKYTFTKMLTYCISYQEYIIMLYVTEVREFGIINSYDIEIFLCFIVYNITATMTAIDMIFVNISKETKP